MTIPNWVALRNKYKRTMPKVTPHTHTLPGHRERPAKDPLHSSSCGYASLKRAEREAHRILNMEEKTHSWKSSLQPSHPQSQKGAGNLLLLASDQNVPEAKRTQTSSSAHVCENSPMGPSVFEQAPDGGGRVNTPSPKAALCQSSRNATCNVPSHSGVSLSLALCLVL